MKNLLIILFITFFSISVYSQQKVRVPQVFEKIVWLEDTLIFISPDNTDTLKLVFPNIAGSASRTIKLPSGAGTIAASATSPLIIDPVTGNISTSVGSSGLWGTGTFASNDSIIYTGTGCSSNWSGSVNFLGTPPGPIDIGISFGNDGRIIISSSNSGLAGLQVVWSGHEINFP